MTLTGNQLLTGLSKFVDDYSPGTSTGAGLTDGTTIVDSNLSNYGDNRLVGSYIRITEGTCINEVCRITSNAQSTGTVVLAGVGFSAQIASGIDYELHKYEPRKKFAALDSARIPAAEWVFRLVYDETIMTDGRSREFNFPPTMRRGPSVVFVEDSNWSPWISWNFIPDEDGGDSVSTWTAGSATLTTYSRTQTDIEIPKYGWTCSKMSVAGSTNGTATLTVGNMVNDVTAALAAGREMTYSHWIYCRVASRVTLKILTDAGTLATSEAHQGRGWELLTVTGNVAHGNATTLSVRIDVSSGAAGVVLYANNGWFYYGAYGQTMTNYFSQTPVRVRRDATTKRFYTPEILPERLQLRLVGKEILTALGDNTTSQTTNTMEVDETSAEILYGEAAEILFQLERLTTQDLGKVVERIKSVRDRVPQLRMLWEYDMPEHRITSPFMRTHRWR